MTDSHKNDLKLNSKQKVYKIHLIKTIKKYVINYLLYAWLYFVKMMMMQ